MSMKNDEQRTALERMLAGFRLTDVLCAGMELGVFEKLNRKPRNAEQMAKSMQADRRGAEILLNAMVSMDLLEKKRGVFRLSPLSLRFLVADSPEYMGNMVEHTSNLRHAWLRIPDSVKTGKPIPRAAKTAKEKKAGTRSFILAMADASRGAARQLAADLDLSKVKKVLDVGGGPGTYLFEMIKKKPGLTGDVFDLPAALEITRELIAENGMQNAVGTVPGDFNEDDIGKGYDLVLLSSIVHIYSPADNMKLIKKCRRALNPGGQLVVKEFLLDPDGTSPMQAAMFSVNMLVNTDGGAAYTEKDIKSWMKGAGLDRMTRMEVPPNSSIIVGHLPAAKKKQAKEGK